MNKEDVKEYMYLVLDDCKKLDKDMEIITEEEKEAFSLMISQISLEAIIRIASETAENSDRVKNNTITKNQYILELLENAKTFVFYNNLHDDPDLEGEFNKQLDIFTKRKIDLINSARLYFIFGSILP